MNSVSLQMKNQLATIRVAGSVQKSTEVMQAMQSLVRVPEVAATMRELSKEMMKAGIIEEMLDETMESVEDSEEVEDEADEEIDKVSHLDMFIKLCTKMYNIHIIYITDLMGSNCRSIRYSACSCYRNTRFCYSIYFRRRRK